MRQLKTVRRQWPCGTTVSPEGTRQQGFPANKTVKTVNLLFKRLCGEIGTRAVHCVHGYIYGIAVSIRLTVLWLVV